jgi:hypothetical protein
MNRSGKSSEVIPADFKRSTTSAKPHVSYEGFESSDGVRRLVFLVKSIQNESIEITVEIPDALFTTVPGISIQDAAPMIYEKIVSLLTNQGTIDCNDLYLTDVDVRQYIERHLTAQKRVSAKRRRSGIAA